MSLKRAGGACAALLLLTSCELPPQKSVQLGYRGVGIQQVYSPERMAATAAAHQAPKALAPAPADSTKAGVVYQNVQALGHVSNAEFVRTMAAITEWVAPKTGPEAGCAYCHNTANMASDEKYQKVVARSMMRMTQNINANWEGHVQKTGVTCYTCHRGNQVPTGTWFYTDANQSLRHYLDRSDVRVQTASALRSEVDNPTSIMQTEYTYELMISMSSALGVNCTYCHNSRQWSSWEESSPKRLLALRGVRMVRDANLNYMLPLQDTWPSATHARSHLTGDGTLFTPHINANISRGPMGDGAKLQCATCHQGIYKPLYGQPMAPDYPALYPAPPAPAAVADTVIVAASSGN
jgi:photosynthetic reaction center cytochrome c subunit